MLQLPDPRQASSTPPTPAAGEVFHSFSQGHVPAVPRAGGRRARHPRRQGLPAQAVPAPRRAGGAHLRRRRVVPAHVHLRAPGLGPAQALEAGAGRLPEGLRPVRRPRAAHLPAHHRDHEPLQPRVPDLHRAEPQQLPHEPRGVRRHHRRADREGRARSRRSTSPAASRPCTPSSWTSSTSRGGREISRDLDLDQRPAHRHRLRLLPGAGPARRLREPAARRAAATRSCGCCAGGGDQEAAKRKALANLERAGVRTTIVSTVAKGVNDGRIGECIRLLFEKDFILSLMFQPAAYTGYGGGHFHPHDPLDVITIPDIVRAAEEQTEGAAAEERLPAPALLAPGLLRAHLPAAHGGRLRSRSRASSSWSSTST